MIVRNKGIDLEDMATKWSESTERLASIATATIKSVKEEKNLPFWKHCKPDEKLDIYQTTEPMPTGKQKATAENLPGPSRKPPGDPSPSNEPQFGLVPGTQILWDFVNNEPVDMIVYEN